MNYGALSNGINQAAWELPKPKFYNGLPSKASRNSGDAPVRMAARIGAFFFFFFFYPSFSLSVVVTVDVNELINDHIIILNLHYVNKSTLQREKWDLHRYTLFSYFSINIDCTCLLEPLSMFWTIDKKKKKCFKFCSQRPYSYSHER